MYYLILLKISPYVFKKIFICAVIGLICWLLNVFLVFYAGVACALQKNLILVYQCRDLDFYSNCIAVEF